MHRETDEAAMRAQLVSGGARWQVGSFCQRDAEAGRALDCGRRRVGPGVQGERARRGACEWAAARVRAGPRAEGAGAKRAALSDWAAGIGKGVGHGEKGNGLGQAFSWVGLGFELGFLFWVWVSFPFPF